MSIDPNDPLHTGESIKDLRKNETRIQSLASKRKKSAAGAQEFSTIAQGVREVSNEAETEELEGEVFVDEYGNVIDKEDDEDCIDLAAKAKEVMQNTNKKQPKNKPKGQGMYYFNLV